MLPYKKMPLITLVQNDILTGGLYRVDYLDYAVVASSISNWCNEDIIKYMGSREKDKQHNATKTISKS